MLNLVMTHSPRLAAIATGKQLGEEVERNPAVMHRLAWLRKEPSAPAPAPTGIEPALRERIA